MTKQKIIDRTVEIINKLPESKAEEISDFANFVIKRYEDNQLTETLHEMYANSETFRFLNEEADLYTEADIKSTYNG